MNMSPDAAATCPPPEPSALYLLSYDHAVGYPNIQGEARKTMALLDRHPGWKSGGQVEGWTWDYLAKHDPAFVAEARQWIARYEGRWEPAGGSYGQPYFAFISEESGIRQMFYGTRAIREHLGFDNRIYLYSEHETMPQMPQILAGMGYRGAILRTHMQYGGDGPARDADWVLWTGLDGSSIPAVPAYSGLEQCWGNMWLMTGYGGWSRWQNFEAFRAEMNSRGVRHPLISRCDDWGTRPNEALLRDSLADPRTHWVTATEYFDVLERSGIPPVLFQAGPNDFFPSQPWGYCGNRTWSGPRVAASRVLTAEALAALAIRNGFKWTAAHQQRLDDAWKNLLIGEHHDSMIVAIYNEARDFTDPSMALSAEVARETAEFVARQVKVEGDAVLVFNPTGHARSEALFLADVTDPVRFVAPDGAVADGHAGPDGASFVAKNVPALGYKVYRIEKAAAPRAAAPAGSGAVAFETARYQVAFGDAGGLVRLRDRIEGRDLIREGNRTGFLAGLIGSREEQSQGRVALTYAGPEIWRAVETGRVGVLAYEITYTFASDQPRIDLDIRLSVPAGTRIGCPDPADAEAPKRGGQGDHGAKLRYVFQASLQDTRDASGSPPPRFAGPRLVRHQPLIIQTAPPGDETLDANLWAAVETDKAGLAISNCGSMGYRATGSTLEPILAYSGEYAWGAKFLDGEYRYAFALIPYGGYSLDSYCLHRGYGGMAGRGKAHRLAVERDRPLHVHRFEGRGGTLPREAVALGMPEVADAVTVQALFPQDGSVFVRLCNMGEKPSSVTLSAPSVPVDLALGDLSDAARSRFALGEALVPYRGRGLRPAQSSCCAEPEPKPALSSPEPTLSQVFLPPWKAQTYRLDRIR